MTAMCHPMFLVIVEAWKMDIEEL